MVYWGIFLFSVVGLVIANEEKKIEISFLQSDVNMTCSVTCPYFPENYYYQSCHFPLGNDPPGKGPTPPPGDGPPAKGPTPPPGDGPPAKGPTPPPGDGPPGKGPTPPPGDGPPGKGPTPPPGDGPPAKGPTPPPGDGPPGKGPTPPPGDGPPGKGPTPPPGDGPPAKGPTPPPGDGPPAKGPTPPPGDDRLSTTPTVPTTATDSTTSPGTTSQSTTTPDTTTEPTTSTTPDTTTEPTTSTTPDTTTEPTTSTTPDTTTYPSSSPEPTPGPTSGTGVCNEIKKQVCLNGDPHYRTFDESHFNYQGTCPHVFVKRCNGTEDFDDFSVKVKNKKYGKVSGIESAQIEIYNRTIFISSGPVLYVDEEPQAYPYYYAYEWNQFISVKRDSNKKISVITSTIQVHLDSFILCVDIPDCPEYFGTDKLCGLAGSYNGYCGDDLVYPNKTMLKEQGYPCTYDSSVNEWANTWNTNDYFWLPYINDTACEMEADVGENRTCYRAIHECEPIRSALKGVKAFAACKDLDYSEVYSEYGKCVDHICEEKLTKCEALENFANFCENKLEDVNLTNWREELDCLSSTSTTTPTDPTTQFATQPDIGTGVTVLEY